ncbi:hypothetical protein RBS60_12200 [Sinomonas sp. ASV486]|uniref:CBU-0592-like domain-containing protein n=1 Tax=Sinomonas puerhi TaxID=3238584 RepID=A0AB39L8D7_9MICC|nr:hypothetical protein [Sinomonas sp. ASV486]MDQ4490955.1 hypothetical protein [Sinomonas sp. ASV486]
MDVPIEVTGWAGAVAVLVAYLSVSMGWLRPGRRFQTANLLGSCAFMVNGAYHGAWPSVVTNIAWFLISVIALLRARLTKTHPEVSAVVETLQTVDFPPAVTEDWVGGSGTTRAAE